MKEEKEHNSEAYAVMTLTSREKEVFHMLLKGL